MYKFVRPELVRRVLDQLDKGDEEAPRMRSVDDQSFEKDPGDLLLYRLRIRFSEQIEERAAEVMRMTVRIPQLICYGVQKQVTALGIEVNRQILEDVHVGGMRDGGHVRRVTLAAYKRNGLRADVKHKSVHQLDVVAHPGLLRHLQIAAQLGQEGDRCACLQVGVEFLLKAQRLYRRREIGKDTWRVRNLLEHVDLQIRREGIWKSHITRERAQDQISHLYAVGWYHVAESIVIVAEEFGEVVQQHQQHSQRALIKARHWLGEFRVT